MRNCIRSLRIFSFTSSSVLFHPLVLLGDPFAAVLGKAGCAPHSVLAENLFLNQIFKSHQRVLAT